VVSVTDSYIRVIGFLDRILTLYFTIINFRHWWQFICKEEGPFMLDCPDYLPIFANTLLIWKSPVCLQPDERERTQLNSNRINRVHQYSDGLQVRRSSFDSRQGQEIPFYPISSRPDIRYMQLPNEWIDGGKGGFWEVNWSRREADHSLPSSAQVSNVTAILPHPHTFSWRSS
jgi:hypothetical protein